MVDGVGAVRQRALPGELDRRLHLVANPGGDPVAVYEVVHGAVERARAGGGPTLVESKVYRLSAHGNIIAPPGVPLHYPEHEAITVFGNREEYEAALRGDPVPRFRATLIADGTLTPEEADAIAAAAH